MTAAQTIREMRMKANVTQAAVAKQWGKSHSLISLFESGQRIPTETQLEKIKKAILDASIQASATLSEYERKVWNEIESIRPKHLIEPPLRDRVRLVKLWARMRQHGIGGTHGLKAPELNKLAALFERMGMTPTGRGIVFSELKVIDLAIPTAV